MTLDQIAEKLIIIYGAEQAFIERLESIGLECANTPLTDAGYGPVELMVDMYGIPEDRQNVMWMDINGPDPTQSIARQVHNWILADIAPPE